MRELFRPVDLGGGLTAPGFVEVEVRERPGWLAFERAMWEEAARARPDDDAALQTSHDEAVEVLPSIDLSRRVLAAATAPWSAQ